MSSSSVAGKVVGAVLIGLVVVAVVEYVTNKFGSVGDALKNLLAGLGAGAGKGIGDGLGNIWDTATERIAEAFGIPTPDEGSSGNAPASKVSDYQPPVFGPPTSPPSAIGTVPQPGGDTETLYSDGSYSVGGTW